MKKQIVILGIVLLVGLSGSLIAVSSKSSINNEKIRIGTFDSRAVAIANFGKVIADGKIEKLYSDAEKAKKAGDTELYEQLSEKGQNLQKQYHFQAFGTADVDEIVEDIESDIKKIAKDSNLDIVVSKFDIVYKKSSIKTVDITMQIVDLFDPDERTMEYVKSIMDKKPVDRKTLEKMDHTQ